MIYSLNGYIFWRRLSKMFSVKQSVGDWKEGRRLDLIFGMIIS